MIASLPMYDRAETCATNDRYWQLIRQALADHGIDAPEALTRETALWPVWQHPELVLSQTCGLPYRAVLHDQVTLVASPTYDIPCPDGHYFSVMVTRKDDPRLDTLGQTPRISAAFDGARLAFNQSHSQSGWVASNEWAQAEGIRYSEAFETGAHVNAARMVAEGGADIAAIDALTWMMILRWEGYAEKLQVIGSTVPTPSTPMITAKGNDPAAYFNALCQALAALPAEDRATLGLKSYVQLPPSAYLAIPTPPPPPGVAALLQ